MTELVVTDGGNDESGCAREGNRRLMRPVKGMPLRGLAALALDRRRAGLGTATEEMG